MPATLTRYIASTHQSVSSQLIVRCKARLKKTTPNLRSAPYILSTPLRKLPTAGQHQHQLNLIQVLPASQEEKTKKTKNKKPNGGSVSAFQIELKCNGVFFVCSRAPVCTADGPTEGDPIACSHAAEKVP